MARFMLGLRGFPVGSGYANFGLGDCSGGLHPAPPARGVVVLGSADFWVDRRATLSLG